MCSSDYVSGLFAPQMYVCVCLSLCQWRKQHQRLSFWQLNGAFRVLPRYILGNLLLEGELHWNSIFSAIHFSFPFQWAIGYFLYFWLDPQWNFLSSETSWFPGLLHGGSLFSIKTPPSSFLLNLPNLARISQPAASCQGNQDSLSTFANLYSWLDVGQYWLNIGWNSRGFFFSVRLFFCKFHRVGIIFTDLFLTEGAVTEGGATPVRDQADGVPRFT